VMNPCSAMRVESWYAGFVRLRDIVGQSVASVRQDETTDPLLVWFMSWAITATPHANPRSGVEDDCRSRSTFLSPRCAAKADSAAREVRVFCRRHLPQDPCTRALPLIKASAASKGTAQYVHAHCDFRRSLPMTNSLVCARIPQSFECLPGFRLKLAVSAARPDRRILRNSVSGQSWNRRAPKPLYPQIRIACSKEGGTRFRSGRPPIQVCSACGKLMRSAAPTSPRVLSCGVPIFRSRALLFTRR